MPASYAGRDWHTLPLTVDNTGFLLDRLGQDCHPLQFLRELTQNSIEAIRRTPEKVGEVIWDVDWVSRELGDFNTYKLSVTDTGDGMTGEEMVKYINQLSSSLSKQSIQGNFGIGAKIAAATRNHAGLIYTSWKEGKGTLIHLWRDPDTGKYGLRQLRRPDGSYGHFADIEDDVRPEPIKEHGTTVVLLGHTEDQNTMEAPEGAPSPSRWIAKYLNTRYFRIPEGIVIKAREGWEHPRTDKDRNLIRSIIGQQAYLAQHCSAAGDVHLADAVAHWWILKDEAALSQNSGWVESSGHIAALYGDELYELSTARAGRARLQNFGVLIGTNRVVIYVEPNGDLFDSVTTNTARTQLLISNQSAPWNEWAAEFRENMPNEIQQLMDEVSEGSSLTDHSKSIRERLQQILNLFRVSRYRLSESGSLLVDTETPVKGGAPRQRGEPQSGGGQGQPGKRGGTAGGVYAVFLKKDGKPGSSIKPDVFPEVRWISVANGTRVAGDVEDRAARYLLDQNVLQINADFRVFTDMVDHWVKEFGGTAAVKSIVEDVVRGWFEQTLIETVIGVQSLKDSKEWSIEDIRGALSENALTASVMPRYHVNNAIKRELGSKLGKLNAA